MPKKGSTSREILEGLAAAISAFVPAYQWQKILQNQTARTRLAEQRAQRRERRAEESFKQRTRLRTLDEKLKTKKLAGGGSTSDFSPEDLRTAQDYIRQHRDPEAAKKYISQELKRLDKRSLTITDVPPADPLLYDLQSPYEREKEQRARESSRDAIQRKKLDLIRLQRALEKLHPSKPMTDIQKFSSGQTGIQDLFRQFGSKGEGGGGAPAPDVAGDVMAQRTAAFPDNQQAPGFQQFDAQQKANLSRAFQDAHNPNLPLPAKIQAWLMLSKFGVPIPQEIQALINTGGSPVTTQPTSRPMGR